MERRERVQQSARVIDREEERTCDEDGKAVRQKKEEQPTARCCLQNIVPSL